MRKEDYLTPEVCIFEIVKEDVISTSGEVWKEDLLEYDDFE